MRKVFFIFILFTFIALSFTLDLTILETDTYVIQNPNGGYDLYIRKKPDIASVLITESTKDVNNEEPNYAFRSPKYNKINGDERRVLNGEFLPVDSLLFSLVDSTPEENAIFGKAFHIWIPYVIEYGYPTTRNGRVQVLDGTFLNIRTFEKPYADYTGEFAENPFLLRVQQETLNNENFTAFASKYMDEAVESFSLLANESKGVLLYATDSADILSQVKVPLKKDNKDKVQVAFVIDATSSMKDDIDVVRQTIMPLIEDYSRQYKNFQIALVLYKDYFDDFLTKQVCNFTTNLERFYNGFRNFNVRGGKDIPEAVYEGVWEALNLNWTDDFNTKRLIVLIGDAPPHQIPRGNITKESVTTLANEKGVSIYPIILPHEPTN